MTTKQTVVAHRRAICTRLKKLVADHVTLMKRFGLDTISKAETVDAFMGELEEAVHDVVEHGLAKLGVSVEDAIEALDDIEYQKNQNKKTNWKMLGIEFAHDKASQSKVEAVLKQRLANTKQRKTAIDAYRNERYLLSFSN